MLDNIRLAREIVADGEPERFASDWRSVYAATRCLEIISEASRRLDGSTKARHPDVAWRNIADAGNIYRHVQLSLNHRLQRRQRF